MNSYGMDTTAQFFHLALPLANEPSGVGNVVKTLNKEVVLVTFSVGRSGSQGFPGDKDYTFSSSDRRLGERCPNTGR